MPLKEERTIRADLVNHLSGASGNGPLNLSIIEIIKAAGAQRKVGDNLFLNHHFAPVWHVTGQGGKLGSVSKAVGAALAAKIDESSEHTVVVTTDADHNSGHLWEALMLASKHNLHNLTIIVNRANMQGDGFGEHVMPLEPFASKLESFNWETIEVDGHNTADIEDALSEARSNGRPTAIIAHTTPGKGISFMENNPSWQHKHLSQADVDDALRELHRS